jgi:hypothetical protein
MCTPMRRIRSPCCARAASGHATADPAIPVTKSRVALPSPGSGPRRIWLSTQAIKTGICDQRYGGKNGQFALQKF